MTNDTEPRALGAALAAPAFVTRGHGVAMHAANRHVERWAPETTAKRVRSMHTLGFVDRLVAPWVETAQRSASLRLFSQYARTGASEREASPVSWVFPRPWYQDELDWMASARQVQAQTGSSWSGSSESRPAVPTLLTTRGTFVAPAQSVAAPPVAMPAALYEYIAPSLSLAASQRAPIPGVGFGGETVSRDAYSPLISLAAVQAAELMSRTVAPLAIQRGSGAAMPIAPGLRSVLTSILERAAMAPRAAALAGGVAPELRLARTAPELVTPPAPSAPPLEQTGVAAGTVSTGADPEAAAAAALASSASESAAQVAARYGEQRARIVELQRIAQQSAQRELAARAEVLARAQAESAGAAAQAATTATIRAAAQSAAAAEARVAAQAAATAEARAAAQAAATAEARAAAQATVEARAAAQAAATAEARAAAQAGATAEARGAAQAAATAAAQAAQTAELRATAERAEAELRQRAAGPAAADAQRRVEAADVQRRAEAARAADAERARLEERVAQRLAERAGAQRLHEQARAEAATHARTSIEARVPELPGGYAAPGVSPAAPLRVPAEVTAAIAGLPTDLAALLGATVAARPERTMQAIGELSDALRTVELLARSSASGAAFEATRGPRLVMPAGLGGLIHAVDRAHAIAERPAMLAGERMLAPLPQLMEQPAPSARTLAARSVPAARDVRVPALSWLSAAPRPSPSAPATALAATATATPAALSHVAWADRWLARFAGANPQSLDTISAAAAAAPAMRMQALANAAPGAVFVAPDFLRGDLGAEQDARFDAEGRPFAAADAARAIGAQPAPYASAAVAAAATREQRAPATAIPGLRLINPTPAEPVRRFDDAAETPDDVFSAIAAAASRSRGAPARPAAAAGATSAAIAAAAPATLPAWAADRPTYADVVAHAAPVAPGSGLSAQLASSPFAPALRHVLPLPSATSFDVRSLFGAGLGATYLAGLIAPTSERFEIGAQMTPVWASWAEMPLAQQLASDRADQIDRLVPMFEAAYVSPDTLDAGGPIGELGDFAAVGGAGAPGAAGIPGAAGVAPGTLPTAATPAAIAAAAAAASAATAAGSPPFAGAGPAALAAVGAAPSASLTTLRSALLSWEVAATDDLGAPQFVPASFASATPFAAASSMASLAAGGAPSASVYREMVAQLGSAARTMLEAMSLPMQGEGAAAESAGGWAAPGMVATRAHSWSVAQERSSSDLALDFVAPELVLAARVYGLGPAEAAQATRLAIAGQSQLGAMASAVDRTFVEAMAIGREARWIEAERQQRIAAGLAVDELGPAGAPIGAATARAIQAAHAAQAAQVAQAAAAARGVSAPQDRAIAESGAAAAGAPDARTLPGAPDAGAVPGAVPGVAPSALPGTMPGDARAAITTAFPAPDGAIAAAIAPTLRAPLPSSSGVSFGVQRATPRGAFLWPAATAAALGMTVAGANGEGLMSVAALELLAAQVVAELGTFTALAEADAAARGGSGPGARADLGDLGAASSLDESTAVGGALAEGAAPARLAARGLSLPGAVATTGAPAGTGAFAADSPSAAAAAASLAAAQQAGLAARRDVAAAEPGESDVLGAAAAMVPISRRARFEALYVALSQSGTGRSWSPAARAARALALAGRGEDAAITARERAATAWDVLPVVYAGAAAGGTAAAGTAAAGEGDADGSASASASHAVAAMMAEAMQTSHVALGAPVAGARAPIGAARARGVSSRQDRTAPRDLVAPDGGRESSRDSGSDWGQVTAGSGLAGLSARAGETLGSYVTPVAAPSAPREGAITRPPTAAPEYVRTGGRYGGGEPEIPGWFEAAARKMLAEKSGDGISLAELTLVTAAPATHIAASSVAPPSPSPATPSSGNNAAQQANAPQIDIEKLAMDVYQDILVQMDIARARNGDSFL